MKNSAGLQPRNVLHVPLVAATFRSLAVTGMKNHAELTDLHLIARAELSRVDAVTIYVRTVKAPDVLNCETPATAHELRVLARYRHIIEEHIGAFATTNGRREIGRASCRERV